jgi:thiamine biosynthesis lipoprotein
MIETLPLSRREWLALTAGLWLLPAAAAARHESRPLFGGPVDLLTPEDTPPATLAAVWRGLEAMNQRWNAWKPGDVSAVNRAFAAGRAVRPTPAVCGLIEGALAMERLSLGCFNAGIGGLVGRWGFHADTLVPGALPPGDELQAWTLARPSLQQIERRGGWLRSRNPRLQLDFGGYAKGVALDWALDRLQIAGVRSALVNLGGNLAAMGDGAARPWRVGIQDPHGPGLLASLDIRGREAVVTSGSYARFRVLDGQPYAHVLDPARGRPVHELSSVTVVHDSAALADAAATALLVAGPLHWPRVAQSMGVAQVLVVDRAGRRQATPALTQRLQWRKGAGRGSAALRPVA